MSAAFRRAAIVFFGPVSVFWAAVCGFFPPCQRPRAPCQRLHVAVLASLSAPVIVREVPVSAYFTPVIVFSPHVND